LIRFTNEEDHQQQIAEEDKEIAAKKKN